MFLRDLVVFVTFVLIRCGSASSAVPALGATFVFSYGATHMKFAASSVLPVPFHFATLP